MTELEILTWGYSLVEGPRVDDDDNLYFSDVHNGGVYRRAPDGTIDVAVPKRRGVGGIALHADGGIVVTGRNVCHVRDGESRIVFAPEAPGLNDLFVDAAGRIICGTMRSNPFDLDAPRTPGECYLVDAEDHAVELYGDVALTNGIGFSRTAPCSTTPTPFAASGPTTTTTDRCATGVCWSPLISSHPMVWRSTRQAPCGSPTQAARRRCGASGPMARSAGASLFRRRW